MHLLLDRLLHHSYVLTCGFLSWRALNDEGADQFDIWKLVPRYGQPAYSITWRDCDGRPVKYGGLHNSVEEVRTALAAKYEAVELWFDDDA